MMVSRCGFQMLCRDCNIKRMKKIKYRKRKELFMGLTYDWYEQDFTSFLLSLDLPVYRKNSTINEIVETEKIAFTEKFSNMIAMRRFRGFSDSFYDSILKLFPEIKKVFDAICKILDEYDNSDFASAQHEFDSMMDKLLPYLFVKPIYWNQGKNRFFRIRVSPDEKLKKPKDLFHVPYKKRYLVGNERYSLAGQPCLYLSTELYIAWQECGYPHSFYYSEFLYQQSDDESQWKFITFISPRKIAELFFVALNKPEECYLEYAKSILVSYPLMFACSIVNQNGNSAFKSEYIIPQMLTQWVYRHYDAIKGICYFSCYDADDNYIYNGYNVVIPAKNIDNRNGLSKDLRAKFKVTKPKLFEHRLTDMEIKAVSNYKKELLNVLHNTFRESSDCLYNLYYLTDLLDKAIRNEDHTEIRLVNSAVRNVAKHGVLILEKYNKEEIIKAIKTTRITIACPDLMMKRIDAFADMYDKFQSIVLDIAQKHDTILDRINSHKELDFKKV